MQLCPTNLRRSFADTPSVKIVGRIETERYPLISILLLDVYCTSRVGPPCPALGNPCLPSLWGPCSRRESYREGSCHLRIHAGRGGLDVPSIAQCRGVAGWNTFLFDCHRQRERALQAFPSSRRKKMELRGLG
jgi:hypothetical protein